MELTKVTMNLTPTDVKNAEAVYERTNARNKAHAVGTALAIAAALTEDENADIIIKHKDGKEEKLIIPGFTH
jgi:ABC-type tungstate transport system permease subunit